MFGHGFLYFILRFNLVLRPNSCGMGLNFLLILQLLAIGPYWECKSVYPCGFSLRKGSIYTLPGFFCGKTEVCGG